MPHDKEGDYQVGYGQPPRHSRFKKGQSGNPKGRPSGKKTLSTVLSDALAELVIVVNNGQRRKITKLEAIGTQLVNKAAAGDPKATQQLLALLLRDSESRADAGAADTATVSETDHEIIQRILARSRGEER